MKLLILALLLFPALSQAEECIDYRGNYDTSRYEVKITQTACQSVTVYYKAKTENGISYYHLYTVEGNRKDNDFSGSGPVQLYTAKLQANCLESNSLEFYRSGESKNVYFVINHKITKLPNGNLEDSYTFLDSRVGAMQESKEILIKK